MRVLFFVLLLSAASPSLAQMTARDGNWWNQLELTSKAFVLFGFMEGMQLGREFATIDGIEGASIKPWVKQSDDSFARNYNSMVAKTSGAQIADGLDAFYKDFRNRSIQLPFAVFIVLKQIGGTPEADIDRLVEELRRRAK